MTKPFSLLATGDHHFWEKGPRFEECKRVHAWMVEEARRVQPSVFLSGGDIYETDSTPRDREAVCDWARAITEICPLVVAKGNHDRERDLAILRRLRTKFPITVVEACEVVHVDDAAIAVVAWPNRSSLAAMLGGASAAEVDLAMLDALRSVLRGLGDQLVAHPGPRVLLGHFQIDGAVTSLGQPLIGGGANVGLADLALARADITIASHIHMPQTWWQDGQPIVMCGSSHRTAFGETEEKSILRATWGPCATDRDLLRDFHRIPTPATQMYLFEGAFTDGRLDITSAAFPHATAIAGAEIRFRYSVASEERARAKTAADELKAEWTRLGAVNVKLEAEVIATTKARAPEISKAKTLPDQMVEVWKARSIDVAEDRRGRIFEKLAEVQAETGARTDLGAPEFTSIKLRGIGPCYPETYELDIASLPGPLVCISGVNGSGKSTILGALGGALFRTTPQPASLAELAAAGGTRDAFLEVAARVGDHDYTFRHSIDGVSGKSEAIVLEHGKPVLPTTSVRAFDAWAATHLPPMAVLYAGPFASRVSAGLVAMSPGDRKKVFLRALGVETLESTVQACTKRASAAKTLVEVTAGRLNDERKRLGIGATAFVTHADETAAIGAADAEVARARDAVTSLAAEFDAAKARLAKVKAAEEQLPALEEAHRVARGRRSELESACTLARGKVAGLETRVVNNEQLLARADAVEAAVAAVTLIDAKLSEAAMDLVRAQGAREAADTALAAATRAAQEANGKVGGLWTRVVELKKGLQEKGEVQAFAERAPDLKAARAAAEVEVAKAAEAVEHLQGITLVGADQRIANLRTGFVRILDGLSATATGADVIGIAHATIVSDDEAVANAANIPKKLGEAKGAHAAAKKTLERLANDLDLAKQKADRLPELLRREAELASVTAEHTAAFEALDAVERASAAAWVVVQERARDLTRLFNDQTALKQERARYEADARFAGKLAEARARLEEIRPQLDAAVAELGQVTAAFDAWTAPPPVPVLDFTSAKASIEAAAAHDLHTRAVGALAVAESAAFAAREGAKRIAALRLERTAREEEHVDWVFLGETIVGVRDLVIDAAGPALTDMANDLLHSCHGPRFTMRIDTTRITGSGKEVEGCEITVLDMGTDEKPGREGPAETFSDGEKAILSEAIADALTMLICQRCGSGSPTLIRDETGAPLDPENGPIYVAMMRRAAMLVGASKVLWVTHRPELRALADSVVDLGDRPRSTPRTSEAA